MDHDHRDYEAVSMSSPIGACNPGELLEVLGEDGQPTGERKPRCAVHEDGDWHRTLHLWIICERGRAGLHVLMQRRAAGKEIAPGKLDVAVGGHLAAGEDAVAALREAEEELGLVVDPAELVPLGTLKVERRYGALLDREFEETYALRCERPLKHYAPNAEEVEVLYELPLFGALALYRDGTPLEARGIDAYGRQNDALLTEADLIETAREDTVRVLLKLRA